MTEQNTSAIDQGATPDLSFKLVKDSHGVALGNVKGEQVKSNASKKLSKGSVKDSKPTDTSAPVFGRMYAAATFMSMLTVSTQMLRQMQETLKLNTASIDGQAKITDSLANSKDGSIITMANKAKWQTMIGVGLGMAASLGSMIGSFHTYCKGTNSLNDESSVATKMNENLFHTHDEADTMDFGHLDMSEKFSGEQCSGIDALARDNELEFNELSTTIQGAASDESNKNVQDSVIPRTLNPKTWVRRPQILKTHSSINGEAVAENIFKTKTLKDVMGEKSLDTLVAKYRTKRDGHEESMTRMTDGESSQYRSDHAEDFNKFSALEKCKTEGVQLGDITRQIGSSDQASVFKKHFEKQIKPVYRKRETDLRLADNKKGYKMQLWQIMGQMGQTIMGATQTIAQETNAMMEAIKMQGQTQNQFVGQNQKAAEQAEQGFSAAEKGAVDALRAVSNATSSGG